MNSEKGQRICECSLAFLCLVTGSDSVNSERAERVCGGLFDLRALTSLIDFRQ